MRQFFENIASDDGIEIITPEKRATGSRCSAVCLCCERTDQPMDDDGCGICDACLGLTVRTREDQNGLELSAPSHLSLTTRIR